MIIDSHTHLVRNSAKDFETAKTEYLLNLEKNDISESIVIADNVKDSDTADIYTLLDIFSNAKNIYLVGSINPFGDLAEQVRLYDNLLKSKKIVALKMFNGFDQIYPSDVKCYASYKLAQKYNVPIIFHTGENVDDLESSKYNDPRDIAKIAEEFNDTKIVIAHFYSPKIDHCLEQTKDVKNIYLDTTVLADDDMVRILGIEKIKNTLEKVIKIKPDKIIFGSDFPACKTKSALDLINDLNISDNTRENILSKNIKELYNI